MNEKRILIVDDEAAILSVLKSSLKKLGDEYVVSTAPDGQSALAQLKQSPFDLVITDYRMAGMDGLELLEEVRALQPNTRTILMTAYGNDKVEEEARRLQAYRYLIKPLEIDDFRWLVKSALHDIAISRPGILILSDERYKEIVRVLDQLRMDVGARCVVLADAEGNSIARIGNLEKFSLERIVPLLGGSIAGLGEVGRVMDGDANTINLVYRESSAENLYVINLGTQLILIILIDRGPYSSKLGTVWYVAQEVASKLYLKLRQEEYASPTIFDDQLEKAVGHELDNLFCDSKPADAKNDASALSEQPSNLNNLRSQNEEKVESNPTLYTFEQAVRAGLIPGNLGKGQERKDDGN